jgi:hypothetical protein
MMTTVVCSKCLEPTIITNRSVGLPFVCESCADVDDPEVTEFYQNIAPANTNSLVGAAAAGDPVAQQALLDANQTDCDTATVENTNLLIEDLQEQLTAERETIVVLGERIANLDELATARLELLNEQTTEMVSMSQRIETLSELSKRVIATNLELTDKLLAVWNK